MAPSAQVQRAKAAVKAMKLIGFNQDLAKKALKRLLKVYEENWEYIEAENYRVLADTILDDQESEDPIVNGTDVSAIATESSHKRLRHSQGDPSRLAIVARAVASGDTNTRGKRAKIVEAQCSLNGQGTPTTAYELLKNGVNEETTPQYSHGCEEPSPSRDPIGHRVTRAKNLTQQLEKEKSVSLSLNERDKNQLSRKLGTLTRYEDKMLGPNTEGIQEVHYKIPDYYNVPHAVFPPYRSQPEIPENQFKAQSIDICCAKASTVLSHANMLAAPNSWNGVDIREVQAQKEMLSSLPRKQDRFSTDIASSNMGEVKLSLIFSSYSPNFQVPSLDSIFKAVENKCLKSYKILQPDFSLMNLMKEVCQCAVDVAADSSREEQEKVKKTTPNCSQPPSLRRMTRRSSGASMELIASEAPGTSMNRLESSQYVNGGNNEMQDNNTSESSCLNDSQSLAVIPLQENSVTVPRPPHDENDIAKGEERVRISLINEFTNEKFPQYFHYIPQNLVYQNAHVNFSLARIDDENCCPNCFGDCLSAPIPCACTREAGGEFVYTLDGLLKKEFLDECISMNRYPDKHHHVYCKDCPLEKSKNEPEACKGHLVRKFIKECWSKCGCSKHCGNRVVQRGISRNLQVFFSDDVKGWGLRTLEELPRGAFICEYVGEIVTNIELYDRTIQKTGGARHSYPVLLDADWASEAGLRDEEALCLDATFYGNIGRFVNHRCYDSNMVEVPVEWETPDHHYYHLAFFTTRKIEMLEELTWDYGIDFEDHSHPIKAFKCICGSKFCRGRRRSRARSQAGSSR